MTLAVLTIGVLMVMAGLVILINPNLFFDPLQKHKESIGLWLLAVVVRIIVGLLLITAALATRFPLALEILGWLAVAAAIFIAAIGRERFAILLDRLLGMADTLGRVSGVFAILFGAFLVYAAL